MQPPCMSCMQLQHEKEEQSLYYIRKLQVKDEIIERQEEEIERLREMLQWFIKYKTHET